jgi:predicted metal-dependent hydrolase
MKIIKSFRKTLSMSVDKTWDLIVKVPHFVSKKKIEWFIEKNKEWIQKRKQDVMDRIRNFRQWEKFMFFWEEYELLVSEKVKKIDFDWMNFYLNPEYKKDAWALFEQFYKKEARKYIKERLPEIAQKYKLEYNGVRISSARTRWWSCSSKRNLNFSYRLIMAPLKVIDYVIVHELAHLKEMNHSKKFRLEVENMMKWLYPWDYKVHKKWLNDHWDKLHF